MYVAHVRDYLAGSGLNDAPARKGRREVESEYLPVFAAGVAAGAQGVMPSYNSIDGVPVTADKWLLTDILRDEWGFDGVAMGDFGAIGRLQGSHKVAANPVDCVAQFLNAGGNQKGSDIDIEQPIMCLMKTGGCNCGPKCKLSEATLNERVKDVLRVKARLGLIGNLQSTLVKERPLPASDSDPTHAWRAHNGIADRLAHESTILLQNTNSTLPIEPSSVRTIAVLGPNADAPRFGDYTGAEHHRGGNINNRNTITLLEGIKLVYPQAKVTHVVGATVLGGGHACGGRDGFETIFRHHFKTPDGQEGLAAAYFDNQGLTGTPALTRTDYAPSFHW
jgi:beta-glucosidase|eukprot:COSAG01_NODE_3343_length_6226_cov_7.362272_3_plen_335_part_00